MCFFYSTEHASICSVAASVPFASAVFSVYFCIKPMSCSLILYSQYCRSAAVVLAGECPSLPWQPLSHCPPPRPASELLGRPASHWPMCSASLPASVEPLCEDAHNHYLNQPASLLQHHAKCPHTLPQESVDNELSHTSLLAGLPYYDIKQCVTHFLLLTQCVVFLMFLMIVVCVHLVRQHQVTGSLLIKHSYRRGLELCIGA